MTRIAGLALAAAAVLAYLVLRPSPPSPAGTPNPTGPALLAERALEALRSGVFETFEDRLTTGADLQGAFHALAQHRPPGAPKIDPLQAVGGAEAYARRLQQDAAASFERARDEAQFTWEGIRLEGWRTLERTWMPGGIPLSDVVIRVANPDGERHFVLADCFETPRGWVTNAGIQYLGGPDGPASSWVAERVHRDVRRLTAAILAYRKRTQRLPETLEALLAPGDMGEAPHVYALPKDPWGYDYRYATTGEGFTAWSAGPDGEPDTDDDVGPPR